MKSKLKVGMATMLLLLVMIAIPAIAGEQVVPKQQAVNEQKIGTVSDTNSLMPLLLGDRIREGEYLYSNSYIKSPNKKYLLYMQGDGNIVKFKTNGYAGKGKKWNPKKWKSMWASDTHPPISYAKMQSGDFEACAVSLYCTPVSGTSYPGSYLQMQNDGKLVIYTPAKVAVWIR